MTHKFDIMQIVKTDSENAELLRKTSEPMTESEMKEYLPMLKDMYDWTIWSKVAVWLALPQMGVLKTAFVVNGREKHTWKKYGEIFINPEIISHWEVAHIEKEWCLSEPGVVKMVARYHTIRVRFYDRTLSLREKTFTWFPARIIQHEMDHLVGVLLSDKEDEKAE